MNSPVLCPGPPLREICTPASRRSRSASESAVVARRVSALDHHHVGRQPLGRQGFARTGDDDFGRRLRDGHADEGTKTESAAQQARR